MRKAQMLLLLTGVLVLLGGQSLASSVVVGTCMPALPHFFTIQSAINASALGGTVYVCPGTYSEQLAIFHPLTLKGVDSGGSNLALITMPPGGIGDQIYVQATGVYLSDLTLDGGNNGTTGCGQGPTGIVYWDSSGTIDHVAIRNEVPVGQPTCTFDGEGIAVFAPSGGASNVTIQNSSIHAFQGNGIEARGRNANITVKNNSIGGNTAGPGGNGVAIWFGGSGTVTGNSIINVVEPVSYSYGGFFGAGYGIILQCSQGVTVSGNTIGDVQAGIVVSSWFCNSTTGNGDSNTITSNKISQTHLFDAVYVCGNWNLLESNVINSTSEAAVNIDDQCNPFLSGYNNTVSLNTVTEACMTSLVNPDVVGGNTIGSNKSYNVVHDSFTGLIPLVGGTCTGAPTQSLRGGASATPIGRMSPESIPLHPAHPVRR